jgi:hypothetical protein
MSKSPYFLPEILFHEQVSYFPNKTNNSSLPYVIIILIYYYHIVDP